MNLLDNELVRKYFSCYPTITGHGHLSPFEQVQCLSWYVLQAMQQPIAMYEKALYTHDEGKTWKVGEITGVPFPEGEFHPTWLKLPDSFQKQEPHVHTCTGGSCGQWNVIVEKPKPSPENCDCDASRPQSDGHRCKPKDEVEEKIEALTVAWIERGLHDKFRVTLRDLVKLAKETK